MTAPVAVVIPALNAERFIAEAIASVLAQGEPVSECIVVDNGSDDRTAEIARSQGVRVITEAVRGAGAARRAGLMATTAPTIMFLDADDLLVPAAVAGLSAALAAQEAAFAYGKVLNEVVPGYEGRVRFAQEAVLSPAPSATLVSRELFDRYRGFDDDNYSWIGWMAGIGPAETRAHVDEVVCRRRIHGDNVTITNQSYSPYFRLIRERLQHRGDA